MGADRDRKSDAPKATDAGRYAVVTPSTAPSAPEPSSNERTIGKGRYVLLRKLGEGSQGETYEAIDRGAKVSAREKERNLVEQWERYVRSASGAKDGSARPPPPSAQLVAVKCFRVGKAKAWKDVELAEREARTLRELDHPRLPKYIEHFEEDGALYLVMEKIEGESLASLRASKRRTWTPQEVQRMLEDIGEALHYLHGRTPFIVHRDIKPGNIIRRPDGSFALVDFGAVRDRLKLQGGSTIVGTFGFMAPEQFQGRASPKSDVYGLGATALWMLTGEEPEDLPHEGLGIDVARALPRGTPTGLVRALSAMLMPDPDRRIDSVDDALAFLRARSDERPRAVRSEAPPAEHLSRREERHRRREEKREEKRAAREERSRLRRLRRSRAAPFLPRFVAQIALLAARIVVWVVVGAAVPILLTLLSLVFGAKVRRGSRACVDAARRADAKIARASAWLSGHRDAEADAGAPEIDATNEDDARRAREDEEQRRLRVSELDQIRVLDPSPEAAQRRAMRRAELREAGKDADAWIEERINEEMAEREAAELDARLRDHQRLRQASPPSSPPPDPKQFRRQK